MVNISRNAEYSYKAEYLQTFYKRRYIDFRNATKKILDKVLFHIGALKILYFCAATIVAQFNNVYFVTLLYALSVRKYYSFAKS